MNSEGTQPYINIQNEFVCLLFSTSFSLAFCSFPSLFVCLCLYWYWRLRLQSFLGLLLSMNFIYLTLFKNSFCVVFQLLLPYFYFKKQTNKQTNKQKKPNHISSHHQNIRFGTRPKLLFLIVTHWSPCLIYELVGLRFLI